MRQQKAYSPFPRDCKVLMMLGRFVVKLIFSNVGVVTINFDIDVPCTEDVIAVVFSGSSGIFGTEKINTLEN